MPITIAPSTLMLLLLGAGSLVLYFASRVVMGAIPARVDGAPIRAYLAAMPVVLVSIVAVAMDRPLVGLHLPIACATAALTFGLGSIFVGRPMPAAGGDAPTGSRSWALVLPAVAITLIASMGGAFNAYVLGALGLFGLLALAGWRRDGLVAEHPHASNRERRDAGMAVLTWLVSAVAIVIAGAMAIAGLPALESLRQLPSDALATAFLLAPAIVVPMVFELLPPCRPIGWQASISSLARFAVICLCVALPLAVLVSAARPTLASYASAATVKRAETPTTAPSTAPSTLFPATPTPPPPPATTSPTTVRAATQPISADVSTVAWRFASIPAVPQRADLLVLAGASLLLLPLSLGAFRPGTLEAGGLFLCYAFNLMLTMLMVIR